MKIIRPNLFQPRSELAVVNSVVVVGALTCCVLLHTVWFKSCIDERARLSNSGTYALKFEPSYNAAETFVVQKAKEQMVKKKIRFGSKNLDYHSSSGRFKTEDSEAVLLVKLNRIITLEEQHFKPFNCAQNCYMNALHGL